jgi:hypothetical protein
LVVRFALESFNSSNFLGIRYGNRFLEIKPKKTAVEVGDASQLVPALQTLLAASEAGELDDALLKAADLRKGQFVSRIGKKAAAQTG